MPALSEHDLLIALVAIAVILLLARALGDIARRLGQPEVLGELFAGLILGPSVLGALFPSGYSAIFLNHASGLVLSGVSWIGAILLLLLAGQELDLNVLKQHLRPGAFAAVFVIVPSVVAGLLFARIVLAHTAAGGIFLGIVLSVTGVSVVAKILLEQGAMRRGYAQVILAAGVASEVVVWLMVAVASSIHSSSPLLAGVIHTLYAVGFFLLVMTVGRRFVFWAMRRVRDNTGIVRGQLSLVLVLTFLAAALTQLLGLHALLGAFVVGVLLSRAPRTNETLMSGLQALTLGMFGPIFFAVAGMRVDLVRLTSVSAIVAIVLLFLVATVVKIGLGSLGARLGGQKGWEALLVGTGLNLKGGTDVVVAVVGTELGLLSVSAYTMYAVVAMVTVLISPMLLNFMARRAPPAEEEQERLDLELAEEHAYVPDLERVLVPVSKDLRGALAAEVVRRIAAAKQQRGQIFDIVELDVQMTGQNRISHTAGAERARADLSEAASGAATVEVSMQTVPEEEVVERILKASQDYDLIAIGANPPERTAALSLGPLQDVIVDEAEADVLIAIDHEPTDFDCNNLERVLVPTNGLEYSMAAADIAGALAHACTADVTLLHVVQPALDVPLRPADRREMTSSAGKVVEQLEFAVGRFHVPVHRRIAIGRDPGAEIVKEVREGNYDLVVLGAVDRGHDGRLYLGPTVQSVLLQVEVPVVLLVGHEREAASGEG